jgi:hypothetical protein
MPRHKTWKFTTFAPGRYGGSITKNVVTHLELEPFKDTAVFPYLVMAANPLLPSTEICQILEMFGPHQHRSATWIRTRRWMCSPAVVQMVPSADGKDDAAQALISQHAQKSARQLTKLLWEKGIAREVDWVYRRRNVNR